VLEGDGNHIFAMTWAVAGLSCAYVIRALQLMSGTLEHRVLEFCGQHNDER